MGNCTSCNISDTQQESTNVENVVIPDPKCEYKINDPLENEGNCALLPDDNGIDNDDGTGNGGCVVGPTGKICPEVENCPVWDLTQSDDDCIVDDYIEEQLNIAGTNLQVFKLLGIHEQGSLQDVTGSGTPISSGDLGNNPASNAFDKFITEWRSSAMGQNVLQSYIGYDFGPIKLRNGRERYGLPTEVMKDISSIKIMQGCDAQNRVTKLRIERSENGQKWYGVAQVNVKDCDGLVTINFRRTVPSRFWRIRPLQFNGGANDYWSVKALQFVEYEATSLFNIQDKILLENRDRDYNEFPILVKGTYTPQEFSTMFDRFGFNQVGDIFSFDVSFSQCVQRLGRPIVIGDILLVESERQYSSTLRPIDKYLEVTDVMWSASGFTAAWKPTVHKIIAKPLLASQETQDVMGKLTVDTDSTNLFDGNDGNDGKKYQDYMDISDNIRSKKKKDVPAEGTDMADIPVLSKELRDYASGRLNKNINNLGRNAPGKPTDPSAVDAMPPNGLPFTVGDDFPTTPANGDYHRLTYTRLGNSIPARLHRYSSRKGRWIYLETDYKSTINAHRPFLKEYTSRDSTKTPLNQIDEELNKLMD